MTCLSLPSLISSNILSPLFLLLLTCSIPPIVQSIARVSVTLHSFSNPENKLLDGSYCNSDQSSCLLKLLVKFDAPVVERLVIVCSINSILFNSMGPILFRVWNQNPLNNIQSFLSDRLEQNFLNPDIQWHDGGSTCLAPAISVKVRFVGVYCEACHCVHPHIEVHIGQLGSNLLPVML